MCKDANNKVDKKLFSLFLTIVRNVIMVTIESCKNFVLGLAYILYAAVTTSYEIDTIYGLTVDVDHGI